MLVKFIKIIRSIIWVLLFFYAYVVAFSAIRGYPFPWTIVELPDFLQILVMSILLAVSGVFLSIDFRKVPFYWIELFFVLIVLGFVVGVGSYGEIDTEHFLRILALLVFHVGLMLFLRTKWNYFKIRRSGSNWSLALTGMVSFGLMIGFVMSLLVGYQLIMTPLSCKSIYKSIEQAALLPFKPVSSLAEKVLQYQNRSIGDVITITDLPDPNLGAIEETPTPSPKRQAIQRQDSIQGILIDEDLGVGDLGVVEELSNLLDESGLADQGDLQGMIDETNVLNELGLGGSTGSTLSGNTFFQHPMFVIDENTNEISIASGAALGPWIEGIKTQLIDQAVSDTGLIRESICDVIIQIVGKNLQNGVGAISIFLVLFFVFSPLISFIFRLMVPIIWFLLFIFQVVNVYKRKKRLRRVEELT